LDWGIFIPDARVFWVKPSVLWKIHFRKWYWYYYFGSATVCILLD
jgi:hypothetical protein